MARHNIYVPADLERLVSDLRLDDAGWSELFKTALSSHLTTLPRSKVERALRRIARQDATARVEQLLPPADVS